MIRCFDLVLASASMKEKSVRQADTSAELRVVRVLLCLSKRLRGEIYFDGGLLVLLTCVLASPFSLCNRPFELLKLRDEQDAGVRWREWAGDIDLLVYSVFFGISVTTSPLDDQSITKGQVSFV